MPNNFTNFLNPYNFHNLIQNLSNNENRYLYILKGVNNFLKLATIGTILTPILMHSKIEIDYQLTQQNISNNTTTFTNSAFDKHKKHLDLIYYDIIYGVLIPPYFIVLNYTKKLINNERIIHNRNITNQNIRNQNPVEISQNPNINDQEINSLTPTTTIETRQAPRISRLTANISIRNN